MKPTDDRFDAMRRMDEDRASQKETSIEHKRRVVRVFAAPSTPGRLPSLVPVPAVGAEVAGNLRKQFRLAASGAEVRQSVANPRPSKPYALPKADFGHADSRDSGVLSPVSTAKGQAGRVDIDRLDDAWFADASGFRLQRGKAVQVVKRAFDIVFASVALVLCAPLLVVLALCVKLESPGPVFYLQTRTGRKMQAFRMIKFRSMRQDAERDGVRWASENDPRITRVGRFLRLTRLDEAPQLINVLIGDMSLIGPRPERPEFDVKLSREIPHYESRYAVLPGLSGWAQVMFTYGASVDDAREKLSYDLHYLKHYSLLLDLQIALKTVLVIVTGKGR